MQLNSHPAPGLGEMLPGWFDVPQNPLVAQHRGITYTRGIGEILPGSFPVPQNPIKDFMSGQVKAIGTNGGSGMSGCGCGCSGESSGCGGGKINGIGVNGLGTITDDWNKIQADVTGGSYANVLQDTVFGVPVWVGLAVLVGAMFLGGDKHSYVGRGRRAARAAAGAW